MSSKLGMNAAYNRTREVSAISKSFNKDGGIIRHESAKLTALENENQLMREENSNLKKELLELRQTVRQIFNENSHEKFDERRVNMIKFQVIQLERQVSLLTDALGSRSEAILEVENTMTVLADNLRSHLASDVQGPMISMSRKDLVALIESSESARIKLFKCVENVNKENVGKELLVLNPFLAAKGRREEPPSLLDVCMNRLDYLNLRHVAQTESKLCSLYKELIRIHSQLEYLQGKGDHDLLLTAHIAPREMERTRNSLLKTCVVIKDVADDLLAISLICPSAPWPILKKPVSKEISVERVLEALPPLPVSKQEEVKSVVAACLAVCNHQLHLKEKEGSALREEVSFHKMIHAQQMQHTQVVLNAIREAYQEFEETVRSRLARPVENLLEAFEHLKNSASETALRKVLLAFKENEMQLTSIVEMLQVENSSDESEGHKALSRFSQEFTHKVDELVKSHKKRLGPTLKDREKVEEEQGRLETELSHLIEELEAKYDKQWVPGYRKNQPLTYDPYHHHAIKSSQNSTREIDKSIDNSEISLEISSNDVGKFENQSPDSLNPSGLRTFLDEDYQKFDKERRSSGKIRKAGLSLNKDQGDLNTHLDPNCIPNDTQDTRKNKSVPLSHSNAQDNAEDCVKRPVKKNRNRVPWRPRREWVDDYSTTRSTGAGRIPDSSQLSKSDRPDNSSRLSPDPCHQPGVHREDSCHNEQRSEFCLPRLGKKKVKSKESFPYEVNLSVAQKRLDLKKGSGSLSNSRQNSDDGPFSKSKR